jgi:hypothetical protein
MTATSLPVQNEAPAWGTDHRSGATSAELYRVTAAASVIGQESWHGTASARTMHVYGTEFIERYKASVRYIITHSQAHHSQNTELHLRLS